MTSSGLINLEEAKSLREGVLCEVDFCSRPVATGSVGWLCESHKNRRHCYGHATANPIKNQELQQARKEARGILLRGCRTADHARALAIANAIVQRGASYAKASKLPEAFDELRERSVAPQDLLEVLLAVRIIDRDSRLPGQQVGFESVKAVLSLGLATNYFVMGVRAGRECAGLLDRWLGRFLRLQMAP